MNMLSAAFKRSQDSTLNGGKKRKSLITVIPVTSLAPGMQAPVSGVRRALTRQVSADGCRPFQCLCRGPLRTGKITQKTTFPKSINH